jgi:glycerol-3-phosphate acyltransferase PlsY
VSSLSIHVLARGIVHISLGFAFVIALFLFSKIIVVLAAAVLTVAFLSLEFARFRLPYLRQWINRYLALFIRREEESRLMGASYFLIGSLITVAAFSREIASLAIIFLALGDPVAAAVGRWKGRVRLWDKTVEGNLACLIVCLVAGILTAIILEKPQFVVAIIGAVFASLFQALPLPLNDNLTIPVGGALSMAVANAILRAFVVG